MIFISSISLDSYVDDGLNKNIQTGMSINKKMI